MNKGVEVNSTVNDSQVPEHSSHPSVTTSPTDMLISPKLPADTNAFSELLSTRLRTEDALQGTLQDMFRKIQDQERQIGFLQQSVGNLETANQPWPKKQFEELKAQVVSVAQRLETLPPDTALVTKKYLKDYDNQWAKRWRKLEETTTERLDRLENRLAQFEENVLRVELKIEHDMKQWLVELRETKDRLSQVEDATQSEMRQGFERVERDVTDLTLDLKRERERLGGCLEGQDQMREQLATVSADAVAAADRISAVEVRLTDSTAKLTDKSDRLQAQLREEAERVDRRLEGVAGEIASVAQAAADSAETLGKVRASVADVASAVRKQEEAIEVQKATVQELQLAAASRPAETAGEAASGGEGPVPEQPAPADILAQVASDVRVKEVIQDAMRAEVERAVEGAVGAKSEEVLARAQEAIAEATASLPGISETIARQSEVVTEAADRVKGVFESQEMIRKEVDTLMRNVFLKEEQERWRSLMEGFSKDLDFFKRKYTRHLGLQVENYTVAGMAREEDLAKIASDVEQKVSRGELDGFLEQAVQKSINAYVEMTKQQEMDEMVTAGTGRRMRARCLACDRDMTVFSSSGSPTLGSGILMSTTRSLSPSKVVPSKSKGFLPKITGPTGPPGPGINPREMQRLKNLAESLDNERPKSSPPSSRDNHDSQLTTWS